MTRIRKEGRKEGRKGGREEGKKEKREGKGNLDSVNSIVPVGHHNPQDKQFQKFCKHLRGG